MSLVFTVHPAKIGDALPELSSVSSVSVVIIDGEKILWTRHKERGWDIPGGHIEEGETMLDALHREVLEEVGATILDPMLIATISSNATDEKYAEKLMCIFATTSFTLLEPWTPAADVDDRALLDVDIALKEYFGDVSGLLRLVTLAKTRISQ